MSPHLSLLVCVGKSVLGIGLNALAGGLPVGSLLLEIAEGVFKEWARQRDEAQRRAELQALAQATADQVRRDVAAAVEQVAAGQPPRVRQALADYLTQVPYAVRQSLRRPADPTGRTIPAGLTLRRAEDLVPFLPTKLPRFRKGDRPLTGVDWELEELLGVGGFGEVWKARNVHLPNSEPVALKFCVDPAAAAALRNEAVLLDRVRHQGRHPGVVSLLHTYLSADPPCLEYEYVEGGELTTLIQNWHRERGGPSAEEAARLVLRLAEIVGHAHRLSPAIVHRDLKPANVLVQKDGPEGVRLRVADFGIGGLAATGLLRQASQGQTTRGDFLATVARGSYTPLYASPQQMRGERPDPRDDVHALGVIWYQLLTGDLGSGAPTGLSWPEALKKRGMSDELVRLLASCIESRAEHRPADAAELASRLQTLLGRREAAPPPPARDRHPVAIPLEEPPAPKRAPRQEGRPRSSPPEGRKGPPVGLIVGGVLAFLSVILLALGGIALINQWAHGPGTTGVSGKVIYKGQPLTSGSVSFVRVESGGELSDLTTAEIRSDGRYLVSLRPGSYKITVAGGEPPFPLNGGKESPPKVAPGSSLAVIPQVYSNALTTPLQVDVKGGASLVHDITIEDVGGLK